MKIAFFVAEYPVTSETFVLRQIRGMVEFGHDVTIIAGNINAGSADPLRGRVHLIAIRPSDQGSLAKMKRVLGLVALGPMSFRQASRKRLAVAFAALSNRLLAPLADISYSRHLGKFDVIVAHFGPAGVRAMYLRDAGLFSGPIVTIFHGFDLTEKVTVRKYLPQYRKLFERTELILPISELWEGRLRDWGAPASKIRVLRMGVDLDGFTKRLEERAFKPPLRVLSAARFVEKKGLIHAIRAVAQAKVSIEYRIIGYGPLDDQLREAARGSSNRVVFLGKLPHDAVFKELESADVFLLPSITATNGDMEGVPVSLMEAMAMGVPVVATRHSGIPELVVDGVTGFLVEERDERKIAEVLEGIAEGRFDLPSIRRFAWEKVDAEFNNAKLDRELDALINQLAL